MIKEEGASGHAWLKQDSSCSLVTHLKLVIGIDEVIAARCPSCCPHLELIHVGVGGGDDSHPGSTTDAEAMLRNRR